MSAETSLTAQPPLEHGRWWSSTTPFRHWRATDVLDAPTYERLASDFRTLLQPSGDPADPLAMKKSQRNYDALILAVNSATVALAQPLFSDAWIDFMYDLVSYPNINRLDGAFHSSPPGSRPGWSHTDLCSAWFDESRPVEGDGPVFPDRSACDYFTGRPKKPGARPVEYVRIATMIYYLANDDWQPGWGGETALRWCTGPYTDLVEPALVPPVDNSLVFFECSPHSYHHFVQNSHQSRNSIVLWIHAEADVAQARWGTGINRRSYP